MSSTDMETCEPFAGRRGAAVQWLPAQLFDAAGLAQINHRAIWELSFPLMASGAVQILFNLIDLWFIGRLSTKAITAVGAVQSLTVVVLLLLGGPGMAVQSVAAQAFGARRYAKASQAVWTALWATMWSAPLAVVVALAGHSLLAPFGLDPQVEAQASQFWFPRVIGTPLSTAGSAILGFFNAIGRPQMTLLVTTIQAVANALLNELFIFKLGFGVAGSGWATTVAQAVGFSLSLVVFLFADSHEKYRPRLTWRPKATLILRQSCLGTLMSLLPSADILGLWIFQLMQVRLGGVAGAATQLVSVLSSIGYIPGFGIASAGTTLVAQSLGSGDKCWAKRIGTRVILLAAFSTGVCGVVLALVGPWLLPLFIGTHDAETAAVLSLGIKLQWIAAGYLFFDGLNLGSAMCLRAAGDASVPASLALGMSWLIFLPMAHSFSFSANRGWFNYLPQFGWGPVGGWLAVFIYMLLLGSILGLRWYYRGRALSSTQLQAGGKRGAPVAKHDR